MICAKQLWVCINMKNYCWLMQLECNHRGNVSMHPIPWSLDHLPNWPVSISFSYVQFIAVSLELAMACGLSLPMCWDGLVDPHFVFVIYHNLPFCFCHLLTFFWCKTTYWSRNPNSWRPICYEEVQIFHLKKKKWSLKGNQQKHNVCKSMSSLGNVTVSAGLRAFLSVECPEIRLKVTAMENLKWIINSC